MILVQIRRKKLMKMICKSFSYLCKVWSSRIIFKRSSALFVSGAKATEQYVYITPYTDFSEIIKQREFIQEEIIRRKCNIELSNVENLWQVYMELNAKKNEYTKRKEEVSTELSKLLKSDPENVTINKLKIQNNLLKENIKKLKVPLWSAEEAAIIEILKLPNRLHIRTPNEDKILYTHLSPPDCVKNHLKIGEELKIIDFKKNENYYLKGEAAMFELGAKFYFSRMLKKKGFVQFSNPDFVKSLIIEGCGRDHTSSDATFILHNDDANANADSRLHLTGGGSLYSFLAYHAKNVLYPKVFPLNYFAIGRQYTPSPSDEDSLFHVSQSSVIETFVVSKTDTNMDEHLDKLIATLKEAYSQLGYHFRLSIISADKLYFWESLRIVVEMYSTSLQDYVVVANVSLSGDYISKRLMFTYAEDKTSKFPHIISGTLLNVPKLLACILEQDSVFSLPESFKIQNWSL